MFFRYATAMTSGTLITLALLYAMQGLIQLQPGAETVDTRWDPAIFIRVPPPKDPPPPDNQSLDPDDFKAVLPPPTGSKSIAINNKSTIRVPHPGTKDIDTRMRPIGEPDGPLIAIVRVQPTYPGAAERQDLEGWVEVRFDVMPNGKVINVAVISSSHRVFEGAAKKAAEKFRFRAPVVNGVAQVATDIEYRFRFEMNDS